jgi:hypothetical protein
MLASVLPVSEVPAKEAGVMRTLISAFALVAAVGFTAVVPATASAGDGSQRAAHDRRVYDRDHRDYHNWNRDEDRMYREYLEQRHRKYRAFSRLSAKQQREYWRWRHDHER